MLITIDLETVPSQLPEVLEDIRADKQAALDLALASIRPPGNYKKQETIDQWLADEAPKQAQLLTDAFADEVDAAYRKTSLDGAYGQICVIGLAVNDAPAFTLCLGDDWANEEGLLLDFADCLDSIIPAKELFTTTVIGHNVCGFDLRFLMQRAIVHGIKPHPAIQRAAQAKPWESEKVADTMVMWAGLGNRIKLDKLCRVLGIKSPKDGIDGSKVWDAVQSGRIGEVAAYCARDVEATRAVYRRLTFKPVEVVEAFADLFV